jgi:hypothetical protein
MKTLSAMALLKSAFFFIYTVISYRTEWHAVLLAPSGFVRSAPSPNDS